MVSKNIKRFRQAQSMTQEELAQKLSVTRQAVSNWENGKTEPDVDMLGKIAKVLSVSVEELIYGAKSKSEVVHNHFYNITKTEEVKKGLSFGAALAMVISYVKWHSIGWAILHGLLNWFYVIYYIIRY